MDFAGVTHAFSSSSSSRRMSAYHRQRARTIKILIRGKAALLKEKEIQVSADKR